MPGVVGFESFIDNESTPAPMGPRVHPALILIGLASSLLACFLRLGLGKSVIGIGLCAGYIKLI